MGWILLLEHPKGMNSNTTNAHPFSGAHLKDLYSTSNSTIFRIKNHCARYSSRVMSFSMISFAASFPT